MAAGRIDDPVVRDQLMEISAMETTKSPVAMRTRAEMKAGKAPGPESVTCIVRANVGFTS